jgi:uncharacterized membrane protein
MPCQQRNDAGWRRRSDRAEVAPIRLRLGQSLVMALEFQVGADIMRTALAVNTPLG